MRNTSFFARIRKRLSDQSGQSTTEYILILAIVVMIASKMKGTLQSKVNTGVDNLGRVIDDSTRPENFRD
jgi:Flp pilus assembly pilin Flp